MSHFFGRRHRTFDVQTLQYEYLIDPEGKCWSEHYPLQVFFRDDCERFGDCHDTGSAALLIGYSRRLHNRIQTIGSQANTFWRSPSTCLLFGICLKSTSLANWPWQQQGSQQKSKSVESRKPCSGHVECSHGDPVCHSAYLARRRVQLPERGRLTEGGVPDETAAIYAGRVVSVNYHPGSLCCLLEQYRFRDEQGNRWPVKIQDCFLVGTATLTNIRLSLEG